MKLLSWLYMLVFVLFIISLVIFWGFNCYFIGINDNPMDEESWFWIVFPMLCICTWICTLIIELAMEEEEVK